MPQKLEMNYFPYSDFKQVYGRVFFSLLCTHYCLFQFFFFLMFIFCLSLGRGYVFMIKVYILQADLNQAISMVSYYASSSEPAQVRGKTVYIQYSNRHEIVNNKSPGDVPGNVLLVTIEGVEAGDVSIDVIHLVSVF